MKYLILILLIASRVFATTRASDGTLTDVNTKIGLSSSGDTVTIPAAGSFTWGDSGAFVNVNKAIHLTNLGATIVMSTTGNIGSGSVISVSADDAVIDGTWTITGSSNGGFAVTPFSITSKRVVVTGITYTSPSTGGYFIYASEATGVCYNCVVHGSGQLQTFMVRGLNARWNVANTMGTNDAWFVEDCDIDSPYVMENDGCASSVIRCNTLRSGASFDMHFIETSTSATGTPHGSRQAEGYNNIWVTSGNGYQYCRAQGGTGMFFDNIVPAQAGSGGANHYYALTMEWGALTGIYWTGLGPDPSPGAPNPALIPTPSHYPVPDQLGIGPYNPTQVGGAESFYYFNNRETDLTDNPLLGFTVDASAIAAYGSTFYQSSESGSPYMYLRGREYFRGVSGGAFPSVSDVGYGTHAQMLASSPTTAGQAWFATDDGTWYQKWAGSKAATAIVAGDRCQIATVGSTSFTSLGASANTVGVVFIAQASGSGTGTVTPVSGKLWKWNGSSWASFYEPYTYPHPLRAPTVATVASAFTGKAGLVGKASIK